MMAEAEVNNDGGGNDDMLLQILRVSIATSVVTVGGVGRQSAG
jgi:hypothetical protein